MRHRRGQGLGTAIRDLIQLQIQLVDALVAYHKIAQ
jgi:hypothetical protein